MTFTHSQWVFAFFIKYYGEKAKNYCFNSKIRRNKVLMNKTVFRSSVSILHQFALLGISTNEEKSILI
jgi:hypothetical protein